MFWWFKIKWLGIKQKVCISFLLQQMLSSVRVASISMSVARDKFKLDKDLYLFQLV